MNKNQNKQTVNTDDGVIYHICLAYKSELTSESWTHIQTNFLITLNHYLKGILPNFLFI